MQWGAGEAPVVAATLIYLPLVCPFQLDSGHASTQCDDFAGADR